MASEDDEEAPDSDRPMTLAEHLDELRKRLFRAILVAAVFVVGCAFYEQELLGILLMPAQRVLKQTPGGAIVATEVGEMFFTGMKVDIVAGLFFAGPIVLWILWGFVARGLYPHERKWVHVYAPVSYVLFLGGCLFFYFVIQPFTLEVLLKYHAGDVVTPAGEQVPIEMKLRVAQAVSFFLSMTLVTGLIFELPLVMLFLQALRITTWRTFSQYRRHFFFGMLVLSALITPTGDAFTLGVFMVPMLLLFEGGLVVCRVMAPKDV
jgi:sec-independent protein translocase protein TatC